MALSLSLSPNLDAGTHLTSGGFLSLTFELTAPASPPTSGPLLSAFSPPSLTPDIHVAASGTHLTPGDSPPLSAAYGAPLTSGAVNLGASQPMVTTLIIIH